MKLALALCVLLIQQIFAVSDEEWEGHKKNYNLKLSAEEESQARANYEVVDARIKEHNAEAAQGKHSFTMGHNDASHLSDAQRSRRHGHKTAGHLDVTPRAARFFQPNIKPVERSSIPDSFDWREKGCVNPIQNQANCGSCWTFSATATLESAYCKATGKLLKLSEQNLVDCAHPDATNTDGCQGGDFRAAWDYAAGKAGTKIGFFSGSNGATLPKSAIGQDTEKSYPYTSGLPWGEQMNTATACNFKPASAPVTAIPWSGGANYGFDVAWHTVTPGDAEALKEAVATKGVISVNIYANKKFEHYKGGVFQASACTTADGSMPTSTNHAVNVIGYGTDPTHGAYWLMRNSYGTSWGEKGYFKFERNAGGQGTCLLLEGPAYPLAAAPGSPLLTTTTTTTQANNWEWGNGGGGGGGWSWSFSK